MFVNIFHFMVHFKCSTTDKKSQEVFIGVFQFAENTRLDVDIVPHYDGNMLVETNTFTNLSVNASS